ncbi:hypothetical protein CAPTEDRAFT_167074 [Capitella teleta]|uniref:asparaginase n=1 Tax=Capitella teleta TaxID=283909 RepID=R7U2D0_CAPTE|nr:hypothetical protein CAPTEDRAFT_167074 [Capitella teleta]|eukprot:ELU00495.1 hypothetical protein CAPTEDRAFT_167074 [Capitella teleta]
MAPNVGEDDEPKKEHEDVIGDDVGGNVSKVKVLYTGGTIGMANRGPSKAYSPEPKFLVQELRKLPIFHDTSYAHHFLETVDNEAALCMPRQKNGSRIIYSVSEYDPLLDSSNMTYADYALLATDIEKSYHEYDAFVILHGTDTMAFTASALSFMLKNLGKPVILTGSQIPIFETRSDGRDNFLGALILAGCYHIPEVTIYFNNVLMRGNRCTKANAESFDAFKSPNMEPLVTMDININVSWEAVFRHRGLHKFCVNFDMCPNVGVLRLFPSITEATVSAFLQPPMQGVVLQTYGAGNGPTARLDLMNVLKEATARGIIIVNCTQCSTGAVSALYSVGKELEEIGVIPGSDMTVEAALMKLSYLLGKKNKTISELRKLMAKNLRGEMSVATEKDDALVHLPLISRLAETMRLSSSQEVGTLKDAIFPYLLCAASRDGNIDALEQLRHAGATFNLSDYDGRTPLHIAASEGHTDTVHYLLDWGAPVHLRDRYGHAPLDDAVRFDKIEVIKLLTAAGAHLTLPPTSQGTLLCEAVVNTPVNALEAWRLAGADLNQGDYDGRTPLHLAVAIQDMSKVDYLMSHGADPLVKDRFGQTALGQAECTCDLAIVTRLKGHALPTE